MMLLMYEEMTPEIKDAERLYANAQSSSTSKIKVKTRILKKSNNLRTDKRFNRNGKRTSSFSEAFAGRNSAKKL